MYNLHGHELLYLDWRSFRCNHELSLNREIDALEHIGHFYMYKANFFIHEERS
jgi:hypothetical protein